MEPMGIRMTKRYIRCCTYGVAAVFRVDGVENRKVSLLVSRQFVQSPMFNRSLNSSLIYVLQPSPSMLSNRKAGTQETEHQAL